MTKIASFTALCIVSMGISSCSTKPPEKSSVPAVSSPSPVNSNGATAFKSKADLQEFISSRENIFNRNHKALQEVIVTGAARSTSATKGSANITNRQEAEVDEGGIVKNYGDYLVILRRGRLFTVSVADGSMKPIAYVNAFPPGESGKGAWYDEMLISGDRVIVVGYSYARGGTEINRFRIGDDGSLSYQDSPIIIRREIMHLVCLAIS